MNPEIKKAIEILERSKKEAAQALTSPENLLQLAKVRKGLDKLINSLRTIGAHHNPNQDKEPGKVTSIFGRKLKAARVEDGEDVDEMMTDEEVEKERKEKQHENEAEWFRGRVALAYEALKTLDIAEVIESYSDMELRGVATSVGMEVTETVPEVVDYQFVMEVKEALHLKEKNDALLKESGESAMLSGEGGAAASVTNTDEGADAGSDKQDTNELPKPAAEKPAQKNKSQKGK